MKKYLVSFAIVASLVLTGCVNGQYQGPPITVGGTYSTKEGNTIGGTIRLDPSFLKQKK